jgi:hypothetical protein
MESLDETLIHSEYAWFAIVDREGQKWLYALPSIGCGVNIHGYERLSPEYFQS